MCESVLCQALGPSCSVVVVTVWALGARGIGIVLSYSTQELLSYFQTLMLKRFEGCVQRACGLTAWSVVLACGLPVGSSG